MIYQVEMMVLKFAKLNNLPENNIYYSIHDVPIFCTPLC